MKPRICPNPRHPTFGAVVSRLHEEAATRQALAAHRSQQQPPAAWQVSAHTAAAQSSQREPGRAGCRLHHAPLAARVDATH
eukprot:3501613-Prymnesium_polylepis.1